MKTLNKIKAVAIILTVALFFGSCEKEDEFDNTPQDVLNALEQMFKDKNLSAGDAIFAESILFISENDEEQQTKWKEDDFYLFAHFMCRWYVIEPWRNYVIEKYELRNINFEEVSATKVNATLKEYIKAYEPDFTEYGIDGESHLRFTLEVQNNKWVITAVKIINCQQ